MKFASTSLQRLRLLSFIALALFLAGSGSSSESRMSMDGGVVMAPDMVDLGQWDDISEEVQPGTIGWLGFDNTTHGLRVRFDPDGGPVSLTESAAMHQPTVEGTWLGNHYGFHNIVEDVYDVARIDVASFLERQFSVAIP